MGTLDPEGLRVQSATCLGEKRGGATRAVGSGSLQRDTVSVKGREILNLGSQLAEAENRSRVGRAVIERKIH